MPPLTSSPPRRPGRPRPGVPALLCLLTLPGALPARETTFAPPQAHSTQRYAPLWTSSLFQPSPSPSGPASPSPVAQPLFPFTLTGIAHSPDRVLVYLVAPDLSIRTLVAGVPSGDLEVLQVFPGDDLTAPKAVLRYQDHFYHLGFTPDLRPYARSIDPPSPPKRIVFPRPLSKSANRARIQSRRLSPGDLESQDWFEGWFEDDEPPSPSLPLPGKAGHGSSPLRKTPLLSRPPSRSAK